MINRILYNTLLQAVSLLFGIIRANKFVDDFAFPFLLSFFKSIAICSFESWYVTSKSSNHDMNYSLFFYLSVNCNQQYNIYEYLVLLFTFTTFFIQVRIVGLYDNKVLYYCNLYNRKIVVKTYTGITIIATIVLIFR